MLLFRAIMWKCFFNMSSSAFEQLPISTDRFISQFYFRTNSYRQFWINCCSELFAIVFSEAYFVEKYEKIICAINNYFCRSSPRHISTSVANKHNICERMARVSVKIPSSKYLHVKMGEWLRGLLAGFSQPR